MRDDGSDGRRGESDEDDETESVEGTRDDCLDHDHNQRGYAGSEKSVDGPDVLLQAEVDEHGKDDVDQNGDDEPWQVRFERVPKGEAYGWIGLEFVIVEKERRAIRVGVRSHAIVDLSGVPRENHGKNTF